MPGEGLRIRFIRPAETHGLRQLVLRPFQPIEEMEWSFDQAEGSFHVGAAFGEELVAVASFLPEPNDALRGWKQYRLRGMAVHPTQQSKGIGGKLLGFGVAQLHSMGIDLLWCNAREAAAAFYAREGFTMHNGPFLIEGIGVHHLMFKRL